MRELVLHIGMNKTGTTSIQSSLDRFDDGLSRYAQLSDINHSIPLYTLFAEDRYDYHIHRSRGLDNNAIDAIAQGTQDCLIKEFSLGRDRLIISGEDIALINPEGIDAMGDFFERHVDQIRVLAYVRDPISFASSALQERIRGGKRYPEIPSADYRKRFEKFIKRFGHDSVAFVGFSKSALEGASVVQDFCKRVDIKRLSIEEQRKNISGSLNCIRMIFLFNRAVGKPLGDPEIARSRPLLVRELVALLQGSDFKIPVDIAVAGVDWDDVRWMEEASGLSLSDSLRENQGLPVCDDPVSAIESLLTTVDPEALQCLKNHVVKFDKNLSEINDPAVLLNALHRAISL